MNMKKNLQNGKVATAEKFNNLHYGFMVATMSMDKELSYIGCVYANHSGISIQLIIPPCYENISEDHESIKH